MFDADYRALNNEQKQVVDTLDQNLLVLAPAGTGKTKVIALRTAYLVQHQQEPEKILCLTFTNKAAKEMKERIQLYIPEQIKKMTIKTFHSFCYHLINHEKENSHFSFPCTLIDEADSLAIIEKIIQTNKLNDDSVYYQQIISFFENIKRHSLTFPLEERYHYKMIVEDYFKSQDQLGQLGRRREDSFLRRFGLKLLNTYRRYLLENNCIDFMDLIVEAKYLLEQPEILAKWRKQYDVIQVDEMQDTSSREYDILKLLAGRQLSLFGDFNQTIYEWRGSNPHQMTAEYRRDFSPLEIHLKINYRSTKNLLEAANGYISSSRLYPMQCIAKASNEGEKITILEAGTKEEEISLLEIAIKESMENTNSIAVLTRTNEYAKKIAYSFNKRGIECTVIEDTKFFRKKEVKELLAFYDYSINDRNGHALLKLGQHPYLNMPNWLLGELRNSKSCYMYLHDWFKSDSKDPYAILFEAYTHNNIVVLDVESTGLSTIKDDVIQIAAIRYGKEGVVDQLDILLKPTKSVGESYYVHGFSDDLLQKEGMEPKEALKQFVHFIQGAVLVGHNVNYDLQIIKSMMSRYKLEPIGEYQVYDTLDLAYKVYPKLSNHKLETLSKLIVTETIPTHNAMQDILATSEVLSHLLKHIEEKKQERLEKIEAYGCYVNEYREKLATIKSYLLTHNLTDGLTFLMNECDFKGYYHSSQIETIRNLYRIINELEDQTLSYEDNIINLLAFSALHYSEIEQSDLFKGRIPIITVHQAKGLEFDEVYIAGCNDKTFPSYRSLKEHQLGEEMRLFYVALTRAKKKLYISYHQEAPKSIFIDQISEDYKTLKRYGGISKNTI